jgi:hypothetical protein
VLLSFSNERLYFKPESLDAGLRAMSTIVFERHRPAVPVQQPRLLADWLRIYVGLVPTWRAEYFERAGGQPQRSVIIAADNVADALEEVRARMAPTCSRAEVTKLDPDTEARRP